jgi:hypothetical protein
MAMPQERGSCFSVGIGIQKNKIGGQSLCKEGPALSLADAKVIMFVSSLR